MVFKGLKGDKRHIIVSAIEHDCVLKSVKGLEEAGWRITRLGVDGEGLINLGELEAGIGEDTALVSIMQVNNEIGVIQDIEAVGRICKQKGVLFHTDAAQSFGKLSIDAVKMNIDLLTASGHKMYGPKGVGMLYIKEGVELRPLIEGGGQEKGLRSGTVNAAGIVGMAKAAEICFEERLTEEKRLRGLRDRVIREVMGGMEGVSLNGSVDKRIFNNINFSFEGVEGEALTLALDLERIGVSTGSACSSASLTASHVLKAIGLGPEQAHGSLRISLGRFTGDEDIDYLLEVLSRVVADLRQVSAGI